MSVTALNRLRLTVSSQLLKKFMFINKRLHLIRVVATFRISYVVTFL